MNAGVRRIFHGLKASLESLFETPVQDLPVSAKKSLFDEQIGIVPLYLKEQQGFFFANTGRVFYGFKNGTSGSPRILGFHMASYGFKKGTIGVPMDP